MQSLTSSGVLGRSASARKAPAPISLREDVGSLRAGGARTSTARERRGSIARSASARGVSRTTLGKAEARAAVGNGASGFCRSSSRGSGSAGRCSTQSFGHGVGEPQVCPRSTVTLCSPNQHLPPAPRESSGGVSTAAAAPPTSSDARTGAFPLTREAPKRSKVQIRSIRVRSAPGGPSGATRPVSGRDTAPPHWHCYLSKSAEASTPSAPTRISFAAAKMTSSPPAHTNTTSSALSIPRFRTARTSASLEAFLLSFQNCLHRQEILFQRVDTAVAQLESARVNAGGATVSPPSSDPTASLGGSGSLPRYVLPSHISSCAPAAAVAGASPTRPNKTVTFPSAVTGARRSDGVHDVASSDIPTDSVPVLSVSSSQQEIPLADAFHHAQRHPLGQSTGSSTLSLSVVVMQPALERVGGNDVGSPKVCSSSQGLLSPPRQTSPLLTLPTYVRLDGAALTPTSAAPSRLFHPHTLFPSSTPGTPLSPARLATTQQQLPVSNTGCTGSLPLNTKATSLVTESPPISGSGGVPGTQRSPAADAEIIAGDPATEDPMLPAPAEGTDAHEAAVPCCVASTAAENTAREDAEGSAGGRRKGVAATKSSGDESASASPLVHSVPMPYLTTTISGGDQSFNSGCGGAGSDGVPTWSSATPGYAKSGSLRIGGIPDSSVVSVFSESADSVSLSPLSRPPSIWVGSPRARSTLGPTSPHQAPLPLQQHSSLGGSSISTAWISPRRVPNSHNSRSSSNAAGATQASANRSPRTAAALENLRHPSTAVNSASSLPSTSQQQPQQRSSGDVLSPLSGQWVLSPSPTPTVSRRASGVAHRSSVQMTSVNFSGSGTQNIGGNSTSGNAGGLVTVMSSIIMEGNILSSLSSTSPLVPPCFPDSGGVVTGAAQAVTSPVTTCRQLTLSSSSPSAEEADRDDSFPEISLRSPIGLAEEADDEDAQQLQQLANRYAPPPPPPSLTELQQQQNQRRRWSAPPVPTMRRPPMAPLRHPDAACPAALRNEEERLRSSTPPVARPEQWLSFEQQHERLHLPECWRDSEVIVVDHVKKDRERDSEEAERLLELEEELLRELRQNQSDQMDGSGPLRRGRRRGSRHRHLMAGANAAGETIDEEELDWGDDSFDEAAADAAYEARLARYGRAMLLHRRGRSHASLYREGGEGCSCGSCPSATSCCCRRRPVSGGDRQGFPSDTTASLRGAPSGESTTLPAATGAPAGSPVLPVRNFSRRHSAPATIWGSDNGAGWRDLQARFEELISIQQRSRGSERDGADGTTLDEQSLSTLANNTASSPMQEGLASGISRRRRSRSFGQEVTACPPHLVGRRAQSAAPPTADLSSSYRDNMPHGGDGSTGLPAPSPHAAAAAPTPLERTHTHSGSSGYRRVQWGRDAEADAAPSPPSQAPEKQRISSAALPPYSSTPPSPPEQDDTPGQSSHARVSAVCTNPPAFLTSPRHPPVTVNAAHAASTRGSAEAHKEAATYDSDVEEDERDPKSAVAARTPVASTAQRTLRLHFTRPSHTASSMGILGRPRRTMGLHSAPGKGRQNTKAPQAGRADGESKTGATPSTTRTLSARQKPQAAAASAVTAASGRRGNTAVSRSGSCGSARGPRIFGSGGGRFTRCSGANSASLDTTAAASIVPTKEADDGAPTAATELNSHGTTLADTGTTMSASHPSDHALDGGELVEPFSAVFVVAAPAAAAAPSPPTTTQKSARDSGTQRGRLRDNKASSSRDADKDHDAHDASLSSPPRHRHRRHAGAEGETAVSSRPPHKASARHAPGVPENEARHPDGGAAAGTTALEGADSRALLRRLAQQKDRTRAMEERLRFGANSTALANPNSGSHSARSGCGSGFVWSDGHIAGRWGLESESCTPTSGAARACVAADLARQDFSTPSNMYSVSAATGDATLDTPVTRASMARHGGSPAADAPHVTVVDPAEATAVGGVHAVHPGAGAGAQQTSSNPRRRRVDLRSRLVSRLTAVSSSLSASPAKRHKGCTATVTSATNATVAATAVSAQGFRRAESAYSIRSRSPTYVNIMHHAGYGDRRRHSIGVDVLPPTTLSMSERQLRSSRAPVASQLVDWVRGGE